MSISNQERLDIILAQCDSTNIPPISPERMQARMIREIAEVCLNQEERLSVAEEQRKQERDAVKTSTRPLPDKGTSIRPGG